MDGLTDGESIASSLSSVDGRLRIVAKNSSLFLAERLKENTRKPISRSSSTASVLPWITAGVQTWWQLLQETPVVVSAVVGPRARRFKYFLDARKILGIENTPLL